MPSLQEIGLPPGALTFMHEDWHEAEVWASHAPPEPQHRVEGTGWPSDTGIVAPKEGGNGA